MKQKFLFLLALITLISIEKIKTFQEWWENSNVFDLDIDNYLENVGKEKYVIIKFYTKWCRYCRLFSPIYEKFYKKMKKKRKDFLVARLEGESNAEICEEYGIHSFPKVAIFYPGSLEMKAFFTDERTLENLFAWVDLHAPLNGKIVEASNLRFIGEDEEQGEEEILLQDNSNPIKNNSTQDIIISSNSTEVDSNKKLENLKELLNTTNARYEKLYKEFQIFKSQMAEKMKVLKNTENITDLIEFNSNLTNTINLPDLNNDDHSTHDFFDYLVIALVLFLIIFGYIIARKVYNKIIKL